MTSVNERRRGCHVTCHCLNWEFCRGLPFMSVLLQAYFTPIMILCLIFCGIVYEDSMVKWPNV